MMFLSVWLDILLIMTGIAVFLLIGMIVMSVIQDILYERRERKRWNWNIWDYYKKGDKKNDKNE